MKTTQEQIVEIGILRHRLHVFNVENFYYDERSDKEFFNNINELNNILEQCELTEEFREIEQIANEMETEGGVEFMEDDLDESLSEYSDNKEKINNIIEKIITKYDIINDTEYCPTGYKRMIRSEMNPFLRKA